LGPFILALVLAYLMLPLVDVLARQLPRVVAILFVYILFIAIIAALLAWLVPTTANQVQQLADQTPTYVSNAQAWTKSLTDWYNSLPLPTEVRQSIETSIRNSASTIGDAVQQGIVGAISLISRTMGIVIGLFIIPFWLFY